MRWAAIVRVLSHGVESLVQVKFEYLGCVCEPDFKFWLHFETGRLAGSLKE